jgi:hypothetical protein
MLARRGQPWSDFMECDGELVPSYAEGTSLCYGEARLASEEQRIRCSERFQLFFLAR